MACWGKMSEINLNRRTFMAAGVAAGASILTQGVLKAPGLLAAGNNFELPPLKYAVGALEPYVDATTMEIHHGKHHATYVNNLNKALESFPELQKLSLEQLLAHQAEKVPQVLRQTIIDNGGGHYNHSLFWSSLSPANEVRPPDGHLAVHIDQDFGGLAKLKERMVAEGLKRFGSGWVWLIYPSIDPADSNRTHGLQVITTANQDSPIMDGHTPLLGIDVWEHAYYLKYTNKRDEYLNAIWNVINWAEVRKRLDPTHRH